MAQMRRACTLLQQPKLKVLFLNSNYLHSVHSFVGYLKKLLTLSDKHGINRLGELNSLKCTQTVPLHLLVLPSYQVHSVKSRLGELNSLKFNDQMELGPLVLVVAVLNIVPDTVFKNSFSICVYSFKRNFLLFQLTIVPDTVFTQLKP